MTSGGAPFFLEEVGPCGDNSNQVDARARLTERILSLTLPDGAARLRIQEIHREIRERSRYLREPDFRSIHTSDVAFLFRAYDERFFEGLYGPALDGRGLSFRLAPRLTRAGGSTARFRARSGAHSFEIAVATTILFDSFGQPGREVTACGLPCADRLEALQRIVEHEMIHLAEYLCWDESNCSRPRFREIAARLFGHREHTHNLMTRRERAAGAGIVAGSRVAFTFEGRRLVGRVNRVTKRATVLVEDPRGRLYSDGLRYARYYVPIAGLEVLRAATA